MNRVLFVLLGWMFAGLAVPSVCAGTLVILGDSLSAEYDSVPEFPGVENPTGTFIASIPYNLYAFAAIALAAFVIWKDLNIGPMKAAEERTRSGKLLWPGATPLIDLSAEHPPEALSQENIPSASYMVLPILVMILTMPAGLYVTGDGSLIQGSGSTAILWSVIAAIACSWAMLLGNGRSSVHELMHIFMKGAGNLLPIAVILLLALTLGDVARLLGTGPYVAGIASAAIPHLLLAPLIFLVSAFIAFSVGSSWGTFAIMIPIAIPIATTLGLPVPLLLGAAISGAVFGDHASPISDTTVVASMASATDHIDHVRTQLPYALLAASIATIGFLLLSLLA